MTWDAARVRHNASVLYNDLCSYEGDKVYVDANGDLQFDNRFSMSIQLAPLGDYSKEATSRVAIRTLRNILRGLETGSLDSQRIIKEIRLPVGCAEHVQKKSSDRLSLERAVGGNEKWVDHKTFGRNVGEARRFRALEKSESSDDFELFEIDLLYRGIFVLTGQIQLDKASYLECKKLCSKFERFDFSSDEEIVDMPLLT